MHVPVKEAFSAQRMPIIVRMSTGSGASSALLLVACTEAGETRRARILFPQASIREAAYRLFAKAFSLAPFSLLSMSSRVDKKEATAKEGLLEMRASLLLRFKELSAEIESLGRQPRGRHGKRYHQLLSSFAMISKRIIDVSLAMLDLGFETESTKTENTDLFERLKKSLEREKEFHDQAGETKQLLITLRGIHREGKRSLMRHK